MCIRDREMRFYTSSCHRQAQALSQSKGARRTICDFGFSIEGENMHKTFRNRFGGSRSNKRKPKTYNELSRSIENRKLGLVLCAMLLAFVFPAQAQQPKKVPHI